jgi:trehalose/maltose hydrolase-like predicted phosphorylase
MAVYDGRRWLDTERIESGTVDAYQQSIDMRTAVASTSYHWVDGTRRMSVRLQTFISRADPTLAATRLVLAPQYAGRIGVRFAIAGRPEPKRLPLATLGKADPNWRPEDIWYPGHMIVRSRHAARTATGGRLSMTSTPVGRTTTLAQAAEVGWGANLRQPRIRTHASGDTALIDITFEATRGTSYSFSQVTTTLSADRGTQLLDRAAGQARSASSWGYAALARQNAAAWKRRWQTDVEVHGNPALQRVVRSMLFYLLCSSDSGTSLGIPPMGLSSAGYYGHIFWDSDTWMFPPLLTTHPDIAQSLVDFRERTLPSARENAKANGFRGAMYPWEANELGRETTPHFAVQNARSEIHINGDVALAQWQYYLITGDSSWLALKGYPVIRETADFWVSRSSYDSVGGRYHIRNVVSVSEGLIGVSDDAYTNAVARKNLEIATRASEILGRKADSKWSDMAAKLHLPYDSASQFYRTYEGAPDSTLGDVTPLLAYPLGVPMSERAKRAQLEQAVTRLIREGAGAMMGSTLLAVDAAELGDRAMVDSLLPRSYEGWLQGPFLMLSETPEKKDAVNFVTGAGGFLQQVLFGWTGLRIGEKGLEPAFAPVLPSRVKRLVLRNVYSRGKRYDVIVDSSGRRMVPRRGVSR